MNSLRCPEHACFLPQGNCFLDFLTPFVFLRWLNFVVYDISLVTTLETVSSAQSEQDFVF